MKNLMGLSAKRLGLGFVRQRSVSAPGFFAWAAAREKKNGRQGRGPARIFRVGPRPREKKMDVRGVGQPGFFA